MKVAILYDNIIDSTSLDQADVLVQVEAVGRALRDLGHLSQEFPFNLDIKSSMESVKKWNPNLVFNLVESVNGSGRLIHIAPAILDFLGIPYTGSGTDALYITSNKVLSKYYLSNAGILTPKTLTMEDLLKQDIPIKGKFIIKSYWEHASKGIDDSSVVTARKSNYLLKQLEHSSEQLGFECFAEQFIDGREFNISLFSSNGKVRVLPPAEIRFVDYPPDKIQIVGYSAKWDQDSFEYNHTHRSFEFEERERSLLEIMSKIAIKCWMLFRLRGYARVDFRVDNKNRPWVLEINANPCLSPDAGFAAAGYKATLEFKELVEYIIKDINQPNISGLNSVNKATSVDIKTKEPK